MGGLSREECGGGIIARVPRVMQTQLAEFHDLDGGDILDVVTCHRGTVSVLADQPDEAPFSGSDVGHDESHGR